MQVLLRKTMREMQKLNLWTIENTTLNKDSIASTYPGEETADERMYSLIDEAIESLPPRQKEVFVLHRYEHFTYLQIAEIKDKEKSTLKAIKAISKYLGQKAGLYILFAIELKKIF